MPRVFAFDNCSCKIWCELNISLDFLCFSFLPLWSARMLNSFSSIMPGSSWALVILPLGGKPDAIQLSVGSGDRSPSRDTSLGIVQHSSSPCPKQNTPQVSEHCSLLLIPLWLLHTQRYLRVFWFQLWLLSFLRDVFSAVEKSALKQQQRAANSAVCINSALLLASPALLRVPCFVSLYQRWWETLKICCR